ncbi:type II secretion system minor pseudopilin GspH [Pseudomonas sp. NPDC012596]|uniref:type II secretion system minor pseudopilin GspH n=1 Tax=Pseudomonas sp. NPDC012596 TaxID=3364419 RepID=UPI0036A1F2A8
MTPRHSRGFTLLELLLVMLLAGIALGMAGLVGGGDRQRLAYREAGLLMQLVQHARQQAVLEAIEYGLRVDTNGYQLMMRSGQHWAAAGQRRALELDLQLEIDGLAVPVHGQGSGAQLVFASNDEYTPFSLYFHDAGVRLASITSDGLNDPWLER